jgi:hypothetical protein
MRKPKAKRPATKAKKKPAKTDPTAVDAKRAKAYSDMESYVFDLVSMGTIAMDQFDKNEGPVRICSGQARRHVEQIQGALLRRRIPDMKRRRRSIKKRNRQRLAEHARRMMVRKIVR